MIKIRDKEYYSIPEAQKVTKMGYWALYYHIPKFIIKKIDRKIFIAKESIDIFKYLREFNKKQKSKIDE
jgi:hypothetical protein